MHCNIVIPLHAFRPLHSFPRFPRFPRFTYLPQSSVSVTLRESRSLVDYMYVIRVSE